MNKWLRALMAVGSSVIVGVLTYGTYGYLTDKKKWSSWKAGAAIGVIGGAASLALIATGMYPGMAGLGRLPAGMSLGHRRLQAARHRGLPSQLGLLVAERVSGCGTCGG